MRFVAGAGLGSANDEGNPATPERREDLEEARGESIPLSYSIRGAGRVERRA